MSKPRPTESFRIPISSSEEMVRIFNSLVNLGFSMGWAGICTMDSDATWWKNCKDIYINTGSSDCKFMMFTGVPTSEHNKSIAVSFEDFYLNHYHKF